MDISDLVNSIDIVDFISPDYVVLEEKNGEYWGLSPFSDEKTPSFSVRREKGLFYCFSTGKGGNIISFIKEYKNVSTHEAIEILKKYSGVSEVSGYRKKLISTDIAKKFKPKIKSVKESKTHILDSNYMQRYELDMDKLNVWEREGISMDSLTKFQVRYDRISDRLVYPIRNVDGDIVNIGGRTLDPDFKIKGLRKYTYFKPWGKMETIYGLSENIKEIKNKNEVIVFEGCKSVLLADTWGIKNSVAILTSHINQFQMIELIKLGCNVFLALDKDVSIRDDKRINELKRYVRVEYYWDYEDLLNDKDAPVDKGREVFNTLYERRMILR